MIKFKNIHFKSIHSARFLALFFFALIVTGCQEKNIGVEGTVTRKGEPLASGTVTFIPDAAKGTLQGANAVAKIENGKFILPEKLGVSGGWYKVIIEGTGTVEEAGGYAVETQSFKNYAASFEFKAGDSAPIAIDIPY